MKSKTTQNYSYETRSSSTSFGKSIVLLEDGKQYKVKKR